MENSPYSAVNMVRHFWSRRFVLVILIPIFFLVAVYISRTVFGETFESTAMLRARTPASSLRTGPTLDELSPPVYKRMLMSDAILYEVIQRARAEFPGFPRGDFEKLRSAFNVEVIMTRDTAIVAEFSPVLVLSAQSSSPEFTYFLASTWLDISLERVGQMRYLEANEIQQTFEKQLEELSKETESLQMQEGTLQQELQSVSALLAAKSRILGGGTGPAITLAPSGSSESTRGLLEERVQLDLQLAETSAAGESPADRIAAQRTRARLERVDALIAQTMEEIQELGARKVEKTQALDAVREQLLAAREKLADVREIIVNMTPDTTLVRDPYEAKDGGDASGSFSVLARPIKPESRIAPPRSVYAAIIAAVLTGILLLFLILEFYIKGALAEKPAR